MRLWVAAFFMEPTFEEIVDPRDMPSCCPPGQVSAPAPAAASSPAPDPAPVMPLQCPAPVPIPECACAEQEPMYPPITSGEYLLAKYDATHEDPSKYRTVPQAAAAT